MRKVTPYILSVMIALALAMPVLAHSGRTDSNGGHRNRSTGEYHYHHGYSAHDHWDMDSDGDLDCPYTFNKKVESMTACTLIIGYAILFVIGYTIKHKDKDDQSNYWRKTLAVPILYLYLWAITLIGIYLSFSHPGDGLKFSPIANKNTEIVFVLFFSLLGQFLLIYLAVIFSIFLFCWFSQIPVKERKAIYINTSICIFLIFLCQFLAVSFGLVWHELS